jgi:hypothetical protein
MRSYITALIILVILSVNITGISAQEEEIPGASELRKFALGLNFQENIFDVYHYYYAYPPAQLTFSMNIKAKFRIEPQAGFGFMNYYDENDESGYKQRSISTGSGFYIIKLKGSLCAIYGFYMDYLHSRQKGYDTNGSTSSSNSIGFGPAAGLDYMISTHFTIGVDFKLLYRYQKEKFDFNSQADITEDSSYKYFDTITGLRLRFYF